MISLDKELQYPVYKLDDFRNLTSRILQYLPNILTDTCEYSGYILSSSEIQGTTKRIRPYNKELFIKDKDQFEKKFDYLVTVLDNIDSSSFTEEDCLIVDQVLYTIQQSIGMGMDLLIEPNSARKNVGNRFEELIRCVVAESGIPSKKIVITIPYNTENGKRFYRCETDIVLSPFKEVKSDKNDIHPDELVVSLKTTTKDRMPKIFIDKILLQNFLGHNVKVVGISQNDIQRKSESKISYTFVSNLFMVYTNFLVQLEGYYYLDPPARALESPYNNHIYKFSKFLLQDVWSLLRS